MMFDKAIKIIASFLVITVIYPFENIQSLEKQGKLLIIYDDYKEYASETNNLNYVVKMALTTGENIEIRKVNSYTSLELAEAVGIIVLSNKEGSFARSQVEELYSRSEELIWIGKNSTDSKVVALNFGDLENILEIKKNINDKFNKQESRERNCYLVIDDVYPYDDLNLLMKKADYLYNQGIPFLVSAMGVYENLDFDAMKRYTEALRYCVSKGGNIILGDPYFNDKGPKEDELISKISIVQEVFVNNKVNPIALTINDDILYWKNRVKYLNKASSIIINDNENLGILDFKSYSISSFDNVLIKIQNEELNFSKELLTDIAIGVKGREPFDDFRNEIDVYKKMGIEFSNTTSLDGELEFGTYEVTNGSDGT
ncbi:MAG: hypothetical protein ACRC68_09235, partial [Clostridium sp.]